MITFLLILIRVGLLQPLAISLQEGLTLMGTKHHTGNGRTSAFLRFCSYAILEFSSM